MDAKLEECKESFYLFFSQFGEIDEVKEIVLEVFFEELYESLSLSSKNQ